MVPVFIELLDIDDSRQINSITKEERNNIIKLLKNFPFTITGLREFKEAIVTQGGVCVKDIDPSTMKCKNINGLSFAGEVLDLDAFTGGFNLQIAWSTGYLAGLSI
jgi:predicted flavoprotein YhiN